MKIFFGINVTESKTNNTLDGEVFVCQKVDEQEEERAQEELSKINDLNKKSAPMPLQILREVLLVAVLICVGSILSACLDGASIAGMYANAPWLFCIGGVCVVAWAVLSVWLRKHAKKIVESDEATLLVNRYDTLTKNALLTLGVPSDAARMDAFLIIYKNKNGRTKWQSWGIAQSCNTENYIFADKSTVYIADISQKFAIPRNEITGIRKIKKRTSMFGWNKEAPYNKREYKPYKITVGQVGEYHLRYYYSVDILHNGETYALFFPAYELETVQNLTGLTAHA